MATETKAVEPTRYWVRHTKAESGEQTLWCINSGKARALTVYRRQVKLAEAGDEVEWGKGE